MHHAQYPSSPTLVSRIFTALIAVWLALSGAHAMAADTPSGATALQEKYQSLQAQLTHNQFARPVYLNSSESSSAIKGDIYAVVDYPFAQVHGALTAPGNWCDVLILHLNTKYCRASAGKAPATLSMRVGKKYDQALDDAYRLDFAYRVNADSDDYFDIRLNADKGPLDTRDYRIQLEAVPVADGRSFLHLTYSYSYGFASRMAIGAYLATAGSSKVGFTQLEKSDGGKPAYVGGMRGTVERNTMRYYLAIDAYLSGLATPPAQQLEQRLQTWYNATERYPRQLHEVDKAEYLAMKRKEYARQNTD
ncbi:hypothetical protein [Herbaspirillum rhizosphaerae]|uniref:hypothetical protein n=1 Tax=Herbaspirillum rhizosphaerae TaxID=346179 RepID=UPI000AD81830|nr:hypothetical protein [Herbaspirillum rhizosphaerae]